jgi:hypothetical protein
MKHDLLIRVGLFTMSVIMVMYGLRLVVKGAVRENAPSFYFVLGPAGVIAGLIILYWLFLKGRSRR